VQIEVALQENGKPITRHGGGNGPIDAFVDALGLDIKLMDYHEHSIGSGANARAACYVELRLANGPTLFGAGIDSNIVTASFKAVLSAVNRQLALGDNRQVA
jgi:2-isopropylmalate synthase